MADLTSTPGSKMTPALLAVIVERERQVLTEGWDAAHDDEHDDGSLALAAACYAAPMATRGKSETADVSGGRGEGPVWGRKRFAVPLLWPDSWDASWWKPKDRRSNLVRAAALLLAEIERMDRAAHGVTGTDEGQPSPERGRFLAWCKSKGLVARFNHWEAWQAALSFKPDREPTAPEAVAWLRGDAHGVDLPDGGQQ